MEPSSPRGIFLHGFEVPSRYTIVRQIGFGSYGQVCSAKDTLTNEKVAVKKMSNLFKDLKDTRRTLREIRLLRYLGYHENIISIKDIILPTTYNFDHLYMVSELMDTDLSKIIDNHSIVLTEEHIQTFLYQILRALKYIHSAGIVHRDLKPNNILVNANCDLRIGDFGMGRTAGGMNFNLTLLEYVTNRYYTPPEGLFSVPDYDSSVDVWSVGCIFAELIGGKPLFPGNNRNQQIQLIIDILGTPQEHEIASIKAEKMREYVQQLPPKPPIPLSSIYPKAAPLALDLLSHMLMFDPKRRITVEQALSHPYLEELHDPDDEPVVSKPFHDELENIEISKEQLRELLYLEILHYHPEERRHFYEQQQQYHEQDQPPLHLQLNTAQPVKHSDYPMKD